MLLFLQLVQVGEIRPLGPTVAAEDGDEESWPRETCLLIDCWGWDR